MSAAFVAVLLIELHFPEVESLKGKRAELAPVRAHLAKLGAAVAEVDHHDLWQRATLAAAVVGGAPGRVAQQCDAIEGWLGARFEHGARVERMVASWDDLVGLA